MSKQHKMLTLSIVLPEGATDLDVAIVRASVALGKNLHVALKEGLIEGWEWEDIVILNVTEQ